MDIPETELDGRIGALPIRQREGGQAAAVGRTQPETDAL